MASLEKEVLLNIINLYKDMPHLWQKTHKDYSNKKLRTEGFRILLELYKNFDEHATIRTIKHKLHNMRSNYSKELYKVRSQNLGSDGKNVYKPSLWYFNSLNFLDSKRENKEREQIQTKCDTLDHKNLASSENNLNQPNESVVSTSNQSINKEKEMLLEEKKLNSTEKLVSNKEEDWEVFGKYIGLQMKDLTKMQLMICQKIISDTIFYAKLDRLTENSYVVTPSSKNKSTMKRPNYQYYQQNLPDHYSLSPHINQSPHSLTPIQHTIPSILQQGNSSLFRQNYIAAALNNHLSSSLSCRSRVPCKHPRTCNSLPSATNNYPSQSPQSDSSQSPNNKVKLVRIKIKSPTSQRTESIIKHTIQPSQLEIQNQSSYLPQTPQHSVQLSDGPITSSSQTLVAEDVLNFIAN